MLCCHHCQTILLNTLWTRLFEMNIGKVLITTAITTMLIAIATAMTAATFPNVAVFATPLLAPGGDDTTTDTTTTSPETAGAGQQQQQQQQQQPIHITKHGTNS